MLNNLLSEFDASPLNTTANIVGTGISLKFLYLAKENLEISKQNFELNKLNINSNDLLQDILNTNKEIIQILNNIISKIE